MIEEVRGRGSGRLGRIFPVLSAAWPDSQGSVKPGFCLTLRCGQNFLEFLKCNFFMKTIPADTRLFHHKLRAPKEERREPPPEMTPDQMKVAEKHFREAGVWLFNLSLAIKDPSPEQIGTITGWLKELTGKLADIRSKIL
jgi:hypothetical protein